MMFIIFIEISRRRNYEHSLHCLPCHIKGKAKQATVLVKLSQSSVEMRGVFIDKNRGLKISLTKICRTIV